MWRRSSQWQAAGGMPKNSIGRFPKVRGRWDIDFSRNEILVRDGKGAKDRITMLPASTKASLQDHLTKVKAVHQQDVADGWGRVQLPDALDRKYPNAPKDWRWQWAFP
jgi:hypothetical protein